MRGVVTKFIDSCAQTTPSCFHVGVASRARVSAQSTTVNFALPVPERWSARIKPLYRCDLPTGDAPHRPRKPFVHKLRSLFRTKRVDQLLVLDCFGKENTNIISNSSSSHNLLVVDSRSNTNNSKMTTITTKRTVVPVLLMVVALIGTISYFRDEMSEFQFPSLVLVDEDGRVLQILEDENATNTTDFPTTFEPSVEETPFPTASPTSGPTSGPSGAPSSSPSASPTATAETPAPTAEATTPEPSPSPFFGDDEVEALTRTPTTASPSIAPFQFPEGTTSEKDEAFPQAMIIGISAGAAACLFLLAGVLLCYKNKKRVPKDGESAFLSNGKSHNTSYSNKSPYVTSSDLILKAVPY